MRPPGMTIQRWMIVVAIAGIACGAGVDVRRHIIETERPRRLAVEAEIEERMRYPVTSFGPQSYRPPFDLRASSSAFARPPGISNPRLALYHRKMTEKRQWALVHPWALLEPDAPPPPE